MKYRFLVGAVMMIASVMAPSLAKAEIFFQLPIVPDTLQFDKRVDYLVTHFWDFCDMKKAFSSRQKMRDAFHEYLDLMPLASIDVAESSVGNFIKSVEKKPEDLLFVVNQAEEYMYSDTAAILSDRLYLPFVKAAAENKKIDKAQRARYEHQARVISNSMVGATAPDFNYIDRNGEKHKLTDDSAEVVLLYFYDTDCADCALTRVRLDADNHTTKLIDAGVLKIIAITPGVADGEWRERVASYPASWRVGAADDIDDIMEIKHIPTFYVLNDAYRIYAKNLDLEQVLAINEQLSARTRDPYIRKMQKQQAENNESAEQ